MAINVNTLYQLVTSTYLNKLQSGGFTITQFNSACATANLDILKQRIGLPEDYQLGAPFSKIAYQITQKITDDVRQFITIADISRNVNGYFPVPADYFAFSSLRHRYIVNPTTCGGETKWQDRKIEVLDDGEFNERLESDVIPPTDYYAVANYYSYGIKVMPENINKVKLTYVKIPQTPVWGYTVVNDQPVYDSTTSTDFDYPVSMTNDIATLVLKYLGVNLLMGEIVQYATERQKQGV
jgi:hypothetical protein